MEDELPIKRRDPSLWDPCPHRHQNVACRTTTRHMAVGWTMNGEGVTGGGGWHSTLVHRLWFVWTHHRNKGCELKVSWMHLS